ncbi:MAG: Na+:solute symporter [Pirellulaceae bacterium]|nr:Na+:solute symporter [Pirellulaceae bacterium]
MQLHAIDWVILCVFFIFTLLVGLVASRRASQSSSDYFLSGRKGTWWLLGTSMVATTFAADTPMLVTGLVRKHGVAGNWLWWAFLLTGMLTVAVYAKLWRRAGIVTDNEFYELRYGGSMAAALRGFRAVYLGLIFNVIVMATVSVAAIKIGRIMFNFSPMQTLLIAGGITVFFSAAGGLTSVLVTDFVMFIVAMVGSIGAAAWLLEQPEIGGLSELFSHSAVSAKSSFLPAIDFSTTAGLDLAMTLLVIPLSVQWWAAWYPGAEPGGGGYIAQRMMAAKNERHATGATLLFNAAHYALRPWPWILIGLMSLVIFPDLTSLKTQFPGVEEQLIQDDLAYPAMLHRLPAGLLGIVATSLVAAYMSTISTHLNWGSSYLVNDIWLRFIHPTANQRQLVNVGRVTTVVLMLLAAWLALQLESVLDGFSLLLKVGFGTGLIYLLRWFWWRINATSEIVAMVVSVSIATGLHISKSTLPDWQQFLVIVSITTVCWMSAALLGAQESPTTLRSFCERIRPGGPGWRKVVADAQAEGQLSNISSGWNLKRELTFMVAGCIAIYAALFCSGYVLYGRYWEAGIAGAFIALGTVVMAANWRAVASGEA